MQHKINHNYTPETPKTYRDENIRGRRRTISIFLYNFLWNYLFRLCDFPIA
jgi:hypothetical protein